LKGVFLKSTNTILFFLLSICSIDLNASQASSTEAADKLAGENQKKHAEFQKRINEIFESDGYKKHVYLSLQALAALYDCSTMPATNAAAYHQVKAAQASFKIGNKDFLNRYQQKLNEEFLKDFSEQFATSTENSDDAALQTTESACSLSGNAMSATSESASQTYAKFALKSGSGDPINMTDK